MQQQGAAWSLHGEFKIKKNTSLNTKYLVCCAVEPIDLKCVNREPSSKILQRIRNIQFKTKEGVDVYFNEDGDPAAKYEIINWQPTENGFVDFVTVGLYDASLPTDNQLNLQNKSLIWAKNSKRVSYHVATSIIIYTIIV